MERMSLPALKKEKETAKSIRFKMIHELRLLDEAIRKVGAVEQLIENTIWEKTEGLCETKNKGDPSVLKRIEDIDKMSLDELKQHLVRKGLL